MKTYHVYLMASQRNGTLYCGITSDLVQRVWQHRTGHFEGFTSKYTVTQLVWYEPHEDVHVAIQRETQIKGWQRKWKLELIEAANPNWDDLYESLLPGAVIDLTRP